MFFELKYNVIVKLYRGNPFVAKASVFGLQKQFIFTKSPNVAAQTRFKQVASCVAAKVSDLPLPAGRHNDVA